MIDAVRFASESVSGEYFDQNGKSMRAAFLRAPLEFRRISSIFGMREHPILGGVRAAQGHGLRRGDWARRCARSATAWSRVKGGEAATATCSRFAIAMASSRDTAI